MHDFVRVFAEEGTLRAIGFGARAYEESVVRICRGNQSVHTFADIVARLL